uniref:Endonuclease/exonuclease/phosphatase domain-containing protein n=1 Tax=Chromera velia CCMP2878 TaxID=1169474 RepID=A0A0G4FZ10_9ALVE|eukprot:Cvel_19424.t1-p1 / transcript=Cvel_19424.t1 / gene=Cvel_19424 / organism=Chromera_velia_CCMP2878 / gene_product=hypothetical protein / transcript_product=hypothetical protein / location=Cvel_scaffold1673:20680-21879(+) / protein_length=400 / sequence_SO=supercontig / SO=protein_coding / is_pseudo=false
MASYVGRVAYSAAWAVLKIPGMTSVARAVLSPKHPNFERIANVDEGGHRNAEEVWQGVEAEMGSGVEAGCLEVLPAFGWGWDVEKEGWFARSEETAVGEVDGEWEGREIRILAWNVMMGMYDRVISGVTQTERRYVAIVKFLADSDADLIALNEIELPMLALLGANEVLRQRYVFSEIPVDLGGVEGRGRIQEGSHGVVLLVRRSLPLFSFHAIHSTIIRKGKPKTARPMIVARIRTTSGRLVAICGAHLEAREGRFVQRRQQARDFIRAVDTRDASADGPGVLSAHQAMIMGDLNMHTEAENSMFPVPFNDAWKSMHHHDEPAGVTWDSIENTLIHAMVLNCDRRQMRLDRVFYIGQQVLSLVDVDIVAKEPLLSTGWSDPGICMSDHYGLMSRWTLHV